MKSKNPSFQGIIQDGKLKLNHRELFELWVSSLKEGQKVYLNVRLDRNIRSLKANAYLWVCYTLISEHTGFTPEEVHEICKQKFLKKTKVFNGKVYEGIGSTAFMDSFEFMFYVEKVRLWAIEEFEIVCPDPDYR